MKAVGVAHQPLFKWIRRTFFQKTTMKKILYAFLFFHFPLACISQHLITQEWKGALVNIQPKRSSFSQNDVTTTGWGARSTVVWRLTPNIDVSAVGTVTGIGKDFGVELGVTKTLPWADLGIRAMAEAHVGSDFESTIPSSTNVRGGIALFKSWPLEIRKGLTITPILGGQVDGGNWQAYHIETDGTWVKDGRSSLFGLAAFFGAPVVYEFADRFSVFLIPSVALPRTASRPISAIVFGQQNVGFQVRF